jgi:hypothetical protein
MTALDNGRRGPGTIVVSMPMMRQWHAGDPQPPRGSVVMVSSPTGTAAQRFYSDGLWHLTTGEVCDFDGLHVRHDGRRRKVYLVWEAAEEKDR